MKKILIILFCLSSVCFAHNKKDDFKVVKDYNAWQDNILELELEDDIRELRRLESHGQLQQEILRQKYRNAEFRFYLEREELRNDLVRAKIYYYYYNNYRRYYYYDIDYHVRFIN